MIEVRAQCTGHVINMVPSSGTREDFPGNNWCDRYTLATFGGTPCLPVGTHTVTYLIEDDCANTSECSFDLTLSDLVPPVAACDETTTVAIGLNDPFDCYDGSNACDFAGVTWVKATTFDDGSYDNCNGVKFTIRRRAPYASCSNSLNDYGPCYLDASVDFVINEFYIGSLEFDSRKF